MGCVAAVVSAHGGNLSTQQVVDEVSEGNALLFGPSAELFSKVFIQINREIEFGIQVVESAPDPLGEVVSVFHGKVSYWRRSCFSAGRAEMIRTLAEVASMLS